MNFKEASKLSSLLAKSFAEELLRLLLNYKDISASEAASRLNLHIKTVQDFLDGLEFFEIVSKREVYEKKRPYYRYALLKHNIHIAFDLTTLKTLPDKKRSVSDTRIRERKRANCTFKTSPKGNYIASITLFTGKTRTRDERKISLTENQGKFLYYLPFPTEEPRNIRHILDKASIQNDYIDEILDIVYFLSDQGIIEIVERKE